MALSPTAAGGLVKAGLEVRVERSAGDAAGFRDDEYAENGVRLVSDRGDVAAADIILLVHANQADRELLREGQVAIGMCDPWGSPEAARELAGRGVTLFALELLPRITRAQGMDVLSSMATVSGYRAVLLAAEMLPKMFPMMMTAAGTILPAHVFVMGVGVAGLQAIATARRLGAVVSANDIRPAVKEQVESLGAKFVQLEEIDTEAAEDKGGYAKEMGEDFLRRQRDLITETIADCDVVITTAAVPGKKAPVLVTRQMVEGMPPGSVIVDLAAERGGNCELTKLGETTSLCGVKIVGPANLPAAVPYHASQMYGKNISTFLLNLVEGGELKPLNLEDEIVAETLVCRDGEVVHPRVRELLGMREPPAEASESETVAVDAPTSDRPADESAS